MGLLGPVQPSVRLAARSIGSPLGPMVGGQHVRDHEKACRHLHWLARIRSGSTGKQGEDLPLLPIPRPAAVEQQRAQRGQSVARFL